MDAELRAAVRTRDGWPVPHAVLTLTDRAGRQAARVRATADGDAAVPAPPGGTYTAIVTAPGHAPAARTVIVTASGADLGTITLARAGADLPAPGAWTIDPDHSTVAAVARHLGLSSVRGRFGTFAGRVEITDPVEHSTVRARIEAASIDTGTKLRDDHLRSADFLNVAEHPYIDYTGDGLTPAGTDRWTVRGRLTLNGVTRPADLDLAYLGAGPDPWGGVRAAFRATTTLRRADYGIRYNQILEAGIAAVGESLKVELEIQAVRDS
ncbi:YceI family protein [Actinomadura rayongensis]|uniref:Lipid/polyisoprenoid-binding YceI-like domain-containing protein n=1 Tax=Actinomadura rayongensis TaxID=1429076 RepID=A0A6I4VW72_9ACTN|nr:YceI family protein [Actinomadura rayongensis]MXQ62569.1 hypothetical protein [Actinomadura rayongensis]